MVEVVPVGLVSMSAGLFAFTYAGHDRSIDLWLLCS